MNSVRARCGQPVYRAIRADYQAGGGVRQTHEALGSVAGRLEHQAPVRRVGAVGRSRAIEHAVHQVQGIGGQGQFRRPAYLELPVSALRVQVGVRFIGVDVDVFRGRGRCAVNVERWISIRRDVPVGRYVCRFADMYGPGCSQAHSQRMIIGIGGAPSHQHVPARSYHQVLRIGD